MSTDRDRVEAWVDYVRKGGSSEHYPDLAFQDGFEAGWNARALVDTDAPPPAVLTADRIKELSREQLISERDEARREAMWLMGLMRAAPPPADLRRVRHKKGGTSYTVLGEAEMQVSRTFRRLYEGDRLVVYRGEDGRLWARFPEEMWDGRFEPIPEVKP